MNDVDVARPSATKALAKYVPIVTWLPSYDRKWLSKDAVAGLTLWGLLVPEAMAYASIAGLPPQAGLYTLVASLLVYAVFGTARHLSVGATSATAALLASSVLLALGASTIDGVDAEQYQAYASAFVLVTGIIFLVAGVARLGFVTQFLSKPVMDGFVLGLAVFVAVGQLNKLFGLEKPEGNTVEKFIGIVQGLPDANWTTAAVGIGALALLFGLHHWNPKLPAGLIVLFAGIAISSVLDLARKQDVEVVGKLPPGLPTLTFELLPLSAYAAMILPAIGVLLVAYSEALGVAREFAERHGYEVDADQELNAHAAANIVSALLGGMLAAGGMSGSAVKEGAGAKSQMSNLVAWVATIITLLFLTPLFASLPEAVLGALIIHAVWRIIAARKLKQLRESAPTEYWFGLMALLGVLFFDVLQGMIIGLVASLIFVIYRSSRPFLSVLGAVPNVPGAWSDLTRHPENVATPGVLALRLDGPLYYANALTVRSEISSLVDQADPPPTAVILDLGVQANLDLTSTDVLSKLLGELQDKGLAVRLVDVRGPVRETLRTHGVFDVLREEYVLRTVSEAVGQLNATGPTVAAVTSERPTTTPRLVLLNGAPGSGKSTLAELWAATRPMSLALDIDVLKHMLGDWDADQQAAGLRARTLALAVIRQHLSDGYDVIVPQFLAQSVFADALASTALECAADYSELVLDVDADALADRLTARADTPDRPEQVVNSAFVSAADASDLVTSVTGWVAGRPGVIHVDGSGTIEDTLARLSAALGPR